MSARSELAAQVLAGEEERAEDERTSDEVAPSSKAKARRGADVPGRVAGAVLGAVPAVAGTGLRKELLITLPALGIAGAAAGGKLASSVSAAVRRRSMPTDDEVEGADAIAVRDVDFSYGHVQVLFDVSLDVRPGEVLALLGTNGAGKSTLLRAISGLSPIDGGSIVHRGHDITELDAKGRVARGIVQVPGGKAVFPSLSVSENLLVGAYTYIWDRERLRQRAGEVLELFPVLRERLDQPAGTLSGGEQQMLALAKALLLDPDVLCIDELSLGLAPVVVQDLMEVVETLKAGGLTMVIVEQSLNVALALADRAVFMEKGRVRFEGPAAELAERDDLARAVFLGGEGG